MAAMSSSLFPHRHSKGCLPLHLHKHKLGVAKEKFNCPKGGNHAHCPRLTQFRTFSFVGVSASLNNELSQSTATFSGKPFNDFESVDLPEVSEPTRNFIQRLMLADLDPATAKLAIGFLGPFLSAFGFLFIFRIVMSWYPKLPVGKFPYVIVYAPTEPILVATRKLIPPLGGVDVTPVVWFGLISFLNEILVGPQGLLVLLSQQVN